VILFAKHAEVSSRVSNRFRPSDRPNLSNRPPREMERDRMIGRLLEVGKNLRLHARVQGSRGNNLLERAASTPPEQEQVTSRPPARSSLKANKLISL